MDRQIDEIAQAAEELAISEDGLPNPRDGPDWNSPAFANLELLENLRKKVHSSPYHPSVWDDMDPEIINKFLSEQRENTPEELQQDFLTIEDFWDRKLWHQLTDLLVDYFSNPLSAPTRLPLFDKFVLTFADKINQLKYVRLGLLTATQCKGLPSLPPSHLNITNNM